MENETRKIDISTKFMQMGQALITEGQKSKDWSITQSGNILIVLSALILSDEDMFLFSQFSAMFTAKKMIDSMKGYDDTESVRRAMIQMGIIKKPRKPRKKKNE